MPRCPACGNIVWAGPHYGPIAWTGLDWTAEQVVAGYLGQQRIERVFRGLKEGDWLRWGPRYHRTDSKIRVHAFHCLLGISLLQSIHKQAQAAWPGVSMEKLIDELRRTQQHQLLDPAQGSKGPGRVATVLSKQSISQRLLADALGLDQIASGTRGQYTQNTISLLPSIG
jgi:transposase